MLTPFNASLVPFPEDDFLWVTFSGELSLGRLTRAHQAYMAHPEFRAGIDELLDFTQSTLEHTSPDDLRFIRRYVIDNPQSDARKAALVVNTTLEYGLGRMLTGLIGKSHDVDRKICFSAGEALQWLRPDRADDLLKIHQSSIPEILFDTADQK